MSAKHPLASANSLHDINYEDLKKEVFYTVPLSNESDHRQASIDRLLRYKIIPGDVQVASNFHSLLRVLRQGRGMSLCGYFPNAPGHEEIKYFDLPLIDDGPVLMAAWRTNSISKEAQNFIEIIPDDPERMTVFHHPNV
jgi:DNA-binding transcriptional LysR family regulator